MKGKCDEKCCLICIILFIFRLIFQLIEFYFVIILTNIIIQTNLILINSTIYDKYFSFLSIPANLAFEYFSLNVLTIYYFELFQFSWIYKNNWLTILFPELLSNIEVEKVQKVQKVQKVDNINIISNNQNKDINNEIKKTNENTDIKNEIINNNENNKINDEINILNEDSITENNSLILSDENVPESKSKEKGELKFIFRFFIILVIYLLIFRNIFNYLYIIFFTLVGYPFQKLINVYLIISFPSKFIEKYSKTYYNSIAYSLTFKDIKNHKLKNNIKFVILYLLFFFYFEILGKNNNFEGFVFFILFFSFLCTFSRIQIEPWIFHKIYKKCFDKNNSNLKKSIYGKISKKYKSFKIFNITFTLVYLLINIFLIASIFEIHIMPKKSLNTVQTNINITGLFSGKHWKINPYSSSYNISSPMCYTKTHYLNFIQLAALANAAYFEDEKNTEENIIKAFELSIFNITGKKFKIKNMTFLTNDTDHVSILQTDFDIFKKKPLTVLSIKGTSTFLDIWLDVEMFLSSLIFSTLRNIPLFTFENFLSYEFNKYATLPFRYLENITLTKSYINNIDNIFTNLQKKTGYGLNDRNYIFLGHSLGGGLAKYIAFKYKLQGISFSGPGVTPLEINLIHNNINMNKTYEKYFKSTFIDIVPDYDIIPRVELSSGSLYRVVCEKGILKCHGITRTLCMMGVMCNKEFLTGDLCKGVYSDKEYKEDFIDVFRNQYLPYKKNK